LALHGSWALGDFTPGNSDLDVLAVMATDPTAATLAALHKVHARLATDFPEWGEGYVEVEYVSVAAIRAVVQGTGESRPMISVGKGEPLHELEASRHSVLNWAAALRADRPIGGAAPSTVLPAIDQRLIHQVVLQHVRAWPEWVDDMQHPGGQAYTVLTLCRAAEALATGRQVSKLAAAQVAKSRFPEWSPSSTGHKSGGTRADPTRTSAGSKKYANSLSTSARGRWSATSSCPNPTATLTSPRSEARQGRREGSPPAVHR
jgi:hypothetical protein